MKPIRRERDADSGNSIVYSSFHLHETGLTPIGAPSFEEWLECGRFIRHAEQSVHFWIGDWLAYGEAHFKEDYEEAIALTGYTYHTLRRDKYMAERIPLERRRSTVDVALHHEVAPLAPERQELLLEKAETEGWTVQRMRAEKHELASAQPSGGISSNQGLTLVESSTNSQATRETNRIYHGDALTILRTLPSESVDMVMSSPPYWALRDYGVDGQLGLEATFEEYIEKLCTIFDEVKRALKQEGTCWVNIGDTYSATQRSANAGTGFMSRGKHLHNEQVSQKYPTLPGKCLVMVPFRFAIAMVNRGWILRNTIIWQKPNAMPESVKDRFTDDFEYLFFFVKSQHYYFKQQFEPLAEATLPRYLRGVSDTNKYAEIGNKKIAGAGALNTPRPNRKHVNSQYETFGNGFVGHCGYYKANGEPLFNPNGRNMRSVWAISTTSYPDAHFAVYPQELVETPLQAGCPPEGTVLDPFLGSGTTAVVAKRLGRQYIGIELNASYVAMAHQRIAKAMQETASPTTIQHHRPQASYDELEGTVS